MEFGEYIIPLEMEGICAVENLDALGVPGTEYVSFVIDLVPFIMLRSNPNATIKLLTVT